MSSFGDPLCKSRRHPQLSPWHRGRHCVRVMLLKGTSRVHGAETEFECDLCYYDYAQWDDYEARVNWLNVCDDHWEAAQRLVILGDMARALPRVTA